MKIRNKKTMKIILIKLLGCTKKEFKNYIINNLKKIMQLFIYILT
jgi:hypothetical protein